MNFTQSTILWAFALAALLALLWPLAARLGGAGAGARVFFGIALAYACILCGTGAAVTFGGRPCVLLAPFLPALLARACTPSSGVSKPAWPLWLLLGTLFVLGCAWGSQLPLYAYDGLLYHLPTAALIWQRGSWLVREAHPQIGSNPVLAEMPKIWAFAISGNDGLAGLQQLPALLALCALAAAEAKRLGARNATACVAALAVALVPKAFEQALSSDVDLIAALLGASAAILISRGKLVFAALFLLLYAQAKYTTLVPAFAGALWLAGILARNRPVKAAAWLVVFTFFGGAWEWQSLARYGTPTPPYQVLVEHKPSFARAWFVERGREDPAKWSGYYLNHVAEEAPPSTWRAFGDAGFVAYDSFSARWGPAWFVLALPALALFFARAAMARRAPVALLLATLFFLLTPKHGETRFGLVLVPFGFAAAAWASALVDRVTGAPAWLAMAPLLAGNAWLIARSHPNPAAWHTPGLPALTLATRDPHAVEVAALANALDAQGGDSLWIDFTRGERHSYGLASTLLYPYFSRDWQRRVEIHSSAGSGENRFADDLAKASPQLLLLQSGSAISPAKAAVLGYRLLLENQEGAAYAKR